MTAPLNPDLAAVAQGMANAVREGSPKAISRRDFYLHPLTEQEIHMARRALLADPVRAVLLGVCERAILRHEMQGGMELARYYRDLLARAAAQVAE